jgi:TonB dependent receptor
MYTLRFNATPPLIIALCLLAAESEIVNAQQSLPTISIGSKKKATAQTATNKQKTTGLQNTGLVNQQNQSQNETASITTQQQTEQRLNQLLPKVGTNIYTFNREAIDALPQGNQALITQILLQSPGVTQDSAVGGNFHIRNEHANVQYRINGIMLPDGASGFSQFLETGFIGSASLITGALPAQYGLRTAGIVDIISRSEPADSGNVTLYSGSRSTGQTTYEYSKKIDKWEFFTAGRATTNNLGIQNTTPNPDAIHDRTWQGKSFSFLSYSIDNNKFSFISGNSLDNYQIPATPGQIPQYTLFGNSYFNSTNMNENQYERNFFNVAAFSHESDKLSAQFSLFSRYSSVYYKPDNYGDLIFNGVASNITRNSLSNGAQGDFAYKVTNYDTIRGGFISYAENTHVINSSLLFPLGDDGTPLDTPYNVFDPSNKQGYVAGGYIQNELKATDKLTIASGLRYDQMWQYINANQLSPRFSVNFKPNEDINFHVAYARYFTPPSQVLAAPSNLDLFNNTTQQPAIPVSSPVLPERSNYLDFGFETLITRELKVGLDAYYKRANNLLDDGQFGQAYVQTAFNYNRGYNTGIELKSVYQKGDLRLYGNLAAAKQRATQVSSNQYLFDQDEYDYISNHYIFTDHAQAWTGSVGGSYVINGFKGSLSMIYGSGLRSGFANTTHVSPYTQVNSTITKQITELFGNPTTIRFDIVNLLDRTYQLRNGTGIGVFAPQYGPRRAFYVGLQQSF